MPDRLAAPGPSLLPMLEVPVARTVPPTDGVRLLAGIGEPTVVADDWWLVLLWVERGGGLATFRELASGAGPPAEPPLFRLGPALAGGLSGMILEEGGRQMMRLRHGAPPADPARPWDAPLVVLAGFRWEPARAATMGRRAIAEAVHRAFVSAVASLRRD